MQNSRQRKFLGKREEVLQCYSCKGEFLVAVSTDDKYGLAESDWYWDKKGWNGAWVEKRIGLIVCYPNQSRQNADCREEAWKNQGFSGFFFPIA